MEYNYRKVKIELIVNPDKEFIKLWELKPRMKKGWKTWIETGMWNVDNGWNVHPQNNKYFINFPKEWFKEIKK